MRPSHGCALAAFIITLAACGSDITTSSTESTSDSGTGGASSASSGNGGEGGATDVTSCCATAKPGDLCGPGSPWGMCRDIDDDGHLDCLYGCFDATASACYIKLSCSGPPCAEPPHTCGPYVK